MKSGSFKWLPSIIAVLTYAAIQFGPFLQRDISKHPEVDAIVGALAVILAHIAPSPVGKG